MGKRSVLFLLGLISLSVVANASTRLHAHTHHHTHAANTYNHFVGDFDGDGVSDFLRQKNGGWAGDGKDTAQIFFSSGIGTFKKNTLPSNFDLRGDLTNLYIGDFNGDGKDDILRQEKGSWASDRVNMAYLLLSNSKGSANFEKIVLDESYDLNGELTNLYIGDFNGDGKDDILRQEKGAWATDNVNMAYLLLSQGKSFKKIVLPDNLALNGDLTNLYVGDFNGDKKADVVRQEKGAWAKDNVNMATLLISTGEGFQATTLPSNFDLTGDQTILQVGDFNGDGKDDLLRREFGTWANDKVNTANLLISTGTGFNKIVLSEDFNIPASLTNAYIGDFNGDGKDDFFRQEKGGWANDAVNMADVFLSTGNNFNEVAYPYDKEMSGEVSKLFVGDFNGDGYDDFIQNWDLDTYYLHFSQGDGTFF